MVLPTFRPKASTTSLATAALKLVVISVRSFKDSAAHCTVSFALAGSGATSKASCTAFSGDARSSLSSGFFFGRQALTLDGAALFGLVHGGVDYPGLDAVEQGQLLGGVGVVGNTII